MAEPQREKPFSVGRNAGLICPGRTTSMEAAWPTSTSHPDSAPSRSRPTAPRSMCDRAEPDPQVLLLHGYGETGDMWASMAADLARDHTVLVPDLRGMG